MSTEFKVGDMVELTDARWSDYKYYTTRNREDFTGKVSGFEKGKVVVQCLFGDTRWYPLSLQHVVAINDEDIWE